MSRAIYICTRQGRLADVYRQKAEFLNRQLTPDNIEPNAPVIVERDGLLAAVINPVESVQVKAQSICLGNMIAPGSDWWRPGSAKPDGTYAIFRSSAEQLEILTDVLASRTVWYIHTGEIFIAATSQRAIIYLLEDFEPNEDAVAWMLANGTLGPGNSWDRRIRALEADSALVLDRRSWKVEIAKRPVAFRPQKATSRWFKRQLLEAIEEVFANLDLDYSKWVLPLSGGIDSRAILLMLREVEGLEHVTWGLGSSRADRRSDAYIAGQLAAHFDLDHRFLETDARDVSFERFFDHFLVAGEGRSANIAGYMDDFRIWKLFFEEGKSGVIRGDNPFSYSRIIRSVDVRKKMGAMRLSEYKNLRKYEMLSLKTQVMGSMFSRQPGESVAAFRDRLYQQYEIPTSLAALNEIKCSFVEVINPLLSRKIVDLVRILPARLRTEKRLFKEIFGEMSPPIPLAEKIAIENQAQLLRQHRIAQSMLAEFKGTTATQLLSGELLQYLKHQIKINGDPPARQEKENAVKARIKRKIPLKLRKTIKNNPFRSSPAPLMDNYLLAFRAFIVCKTAQLFDHDVKRARAFSRKNSRGRDK